MKRLLILATLLIAVISCTSAEAQDGPDVWVFAQGCGWFDRHNGTAHLHIEITAENQTDADFIDASSRVNMLGKNGEIVLSIPGPYIGQWEHGVNNNYYFKRTVNIAKADALKIYGCKAEFTELGEPLVTRQDRTDMWGDHPEY